MSSPIFPDDALDAAKRSLEFPAPHGTAGKSPERIEEERQLSDKRFRSAMPPQARREPVTVTIGPREHALRITAKEPVGFEKSWPIMVESFRADVVKLAREYNAIVQDVYGKVLE